MIMSAPFNIKFSLNIKATDTKVDLKFSVYNNFGNLFHIISIAVASV